MPLDIVFADLRSIYQAETDRLEDRKRPRLTEHDLQRWTALIGASRAAVYDGIAIHLARGFHMRNLTFEFCDAIVNDIHGIITSGDEVRPDLFWDVYLAFDEGEYYHQDNRDEDPVEAYTRPLIARIVADTSSR